MSKLELPKEYLGDSVYAEWADFALTLTTENGKPDDPSNTIIFELEVLEKLVGYIDRVMADALAAGVKP